MNAEFLVLRSIYEENTVSQRDIASSFDISLGKVNMLIKDAIDKKLITFDDQYKLTKEGETFLKKNKVDTAIILAEETLSKDENGKYIPIGLRKINAEVLIERNIRLLIEKNIKNIYLVAGNLIETYEYLIDKYDIKIIYDEDYDSKNTLSKLYKAKDILKEKDCYILPSNLYAIKNIFHEYEIESYIYGRYLDNLLDNLGLIVNNKNVILGVQDGGENQYAITNTSFLTKDYSKALIKLFKGYNDLPSANNFTYEDVIIRNLDLLDDIYVYKIKKPIYVEIKKDFDFSLYDKRMIENNKFPISYIATTFGVKEKDIVDIKKMDGIEDKKIFTFSVAKKSYEHKKYIVREVSEDKKLLRSIEEEKALYNELIDVPFFEKILYIDEDFKVIKEYIDGYKIADINNQEIRKVVLHLYRRMHNSGIKISRELDIENLLDNYIDIINKLHIDVLYKDFRNSTYEVKKLIYFIGGQKRPKVVCKNFFQCDDICYTDKGVNIQNIDTVALCDPLNDIASIASYINASESDTIKIFDEYNNMVDIDNIALQNIDKSRARNMTICFLAIQYFIKAVQVLIKENVCMVKDKNVGFIKYRLFKQCIQYIQKNKII